MTITTITVSTTAQLYDALSRATGGETIKLAAGDYGTLNLNSGSGFSVNFPSNVTIVSQTPLQPATFSGMDLRNVSNLTVSGVVFDYTFKAGDPSYITPFSVQGGSNVTIRNSTFDGDVASGISASDNGYPYGTGLSVSGTTNAKVIGNEFTNFYRGLAVTGAKSTTVSGNDVHDIRSDGMDFVQVNGLTVSRNHIHDFRTNQASGDHPDMIQFWTAGTTAPSTNIVIRNNVLDSGNGPWTQSIFMGNELVSQGLAGTEMYYRNVTIANNVITNGHYHGITVGQAIGVAITNNTVLHTDGNAPDGADSTVEIPQINVAPEATGVTITQNITAAISGYTNQTGWSVAQNVIVQDQNPDAAGYYADLFITSSLTPQHGVHGFLALPGSIIDQLGAGATATRDYLPADGKVAAVFLATADDGGSVQTRTFDAGLSLSHLGELPVGTTFNWSFGDGTSATGAKVVHAFDQGGEYTVKLTVTLPTGVSDTVVGNVPVYDRDLVHLRSDGAFQLTDPDASTILPAGTSAGLQLGAAGTSVTISADHVTELTRVKDFDIVMKLNADTTTSNGEVFRLHGGVVAYVDAAGKLQVQVTDQTNHTVQLSSGAISMTDLKSHAIDIKLTDGNLQLWVDGKMTSSGAFSGEMNSFGATDLTFGNPWGGKNFLGDITAFDIKIGEQALAQSKTILAMSPDGTFGGTTGLTAAPAAATGLHLDDGVSARVDAGLLTGLLSSSDVNVGLQLKSDTADTYGNVLRLDGSLRARFNTDGEFVVFATDDSGKEVRLSTTGMDLTDMKAHDLDLRLDNGKLQIWVDGTLSAQRDFAGTLHDATASEMTFGLPVASGITNFHGDMTAFDVSVAADNGWTV